MSVTVLDDVHHLAQAPCDTHGATGSVDVVQAQLALWSATLDGIEDLRKATSNRLYQVGALGLIGSRETAATEGLRDGLDKLEHDAVLQLQRTLRRHPLGPWVKRTIGVGEKQGARLIAAIGDPYWNAAVDRPRRGPAELWAYCGYHVLHLGPERGGAHAAIAEVQPLHPGQVTNGAQVSTAGVQPSDTSDQRFGDAQRTIVAGVAPRRAKGQKANWNDTAKMRAFLVAESCVKAATSPYRPVYDLGRLKYGEAIHAHSCHRCGPAGHPAQPGSPLSPGHQHARALRLVAKAVLRDLYLEARSLHESGAWPT